MKTNLLKIMTLLATLGLLLNAAPKIAKDLEKANPSKSADVIVQFTGRSRKR